MLKSIKAKLTLSLISLILVPFMIVSLVIGVQVQTNSVDEFKKSSENEIRQFEQYVSLFFNGIKKNVESVSSFPELNNIPGNLKTYHHTTSKTPAFPDPDNETQMSIFNFLSTMLSGQKDYAVIYVGAKDSGFIKAPKGMAGAGYNPLKRGWYGEAIAAKGEISISKAYRSTSGESVIAVAKELRNNSGERVGVLGVDISLGTLTKTIEKIKIGKTGHIILIQGDGTVLANPGDPKTNFKKMSDLDNESYKKLSAVKNGLVEVNLGGKEQFVNVITSADKKWKYMAVIDKNEVTASAHRIVKLIILIALALVAISICVGQFMASRLSKQLLSITSKLKSASEEVSVVSEELSGVATILSDSARQQASSVEETSASLEEVSGMVRNNAQKAQVTVDQIEEVTTVTESANGSMGQLSQSMQDILESNKQIEDLVSLIENIADKTAIMDEIVFQTKLLSFNASVEAERAGEHGRGFAVVAQEVGNLAQLSGDAAQEIAEIVKSSIDSTRNITTNNTKRVVEGEEYLKKTTESFCAITESNATISGGANQILKASKEQQLGVEQITTAMEMLDSVTQQSSVTADKTAETGRQLLTQSELMNSIVRELTRIVTGKELEHVAKVEEISESEAPENNIVQMKQPVEQTQEDDHWEAI